MIGIAFVAGATGSVLAQSQTTTPAKEEKKADKPAEAKKPVAHSANGTVKSSAADTLVVSGKGKGGKDTDWTFALDAKTKIRKAGKDVAVTDLAAGDLVNVRYHDEGGKSVAETVMVRAPKKAAAKDQPKK
jgi:hypothetical protein